MPSGTVSQVLGGKYPSSPTKQLNQLLSVLDTETERLKDGTPGYVRAACTSCCRSFSTAPASIRTSV
jgi:tRNA U34 5-carboxymethylaminomethyl modifying enzyme MnmG/GidA